MTCSKCQGGCTCGEPSMPAVRDQQTNSHLKMLCSMRFAAGMGEDSDLSQQTLMSTFIFLLALRRPVHLDGRYKCISLLSMCYHALSGSGRPSLST